jgi:glutathione S-transferase
MHYVEIEEAIAKPGLRLVLTPHVPGPFGEAAKAILHVKKIPYLPVRQPTEQQDRRALMSWTRQTSAPVAMYEDERPRSGWAEILFLAERLAPAPRLVPVDPFERALMFGLSHELCGEHGLAWTRRLQMLPRGMKREPETMAWKYGLEDEAAVERAPARANEILAMLAAQLERQRAAGSRFFVGGALTALDLYWACFSNMVAPMPPERSPMPDFLRGIYGGAPGVRTPAPILLEHRDFVFDEYLELPQDF